MTAQAITAALEEASIAGWEAGDGRVIEIYVSQVVTVVERVLREEEARWNRLRAEIAELRTVHYERACDLADEGKDGDERAFGRVEAYDELLATMDRMEAGQ